MALAATTLMLGSAAAQTMEDAVAKYEAAMGAMKEKKLPEAVKLLEAAADMGIDLGEDGAELVRECQGIIPKVYLQMGMAAAQAKKFDEAIAELLKCEELADLYGDVTTKRNASRFISNVYMVKGTEAFNAKDYAKALESFQKGYEQDPANIKLAAYTAKSLAELGKLEEAAPIYKTVIEAAAANSKFEADGVAAKEDLVIYTLVAASEAGQADNWDGVVKYTDQVFQVIPNEPQSSLLLIQMANKLKKYDVIIEKGVAAAEAQTADDKKADVYLLVGDAYQNKGNKDKAIEMLKKVTSGAGVATAKQIISDLSK